MISAEFYIMYGFQAFICVLLVTMLVAMFRIVKDVARLERGQLALNEKIDNVERSLNARIDGVEQRLNVRMDGLERRMDGLERRMDGLESQLLGLRELVFVQGREISEIKGLVIALHERVELVMRHRRQADAEVIPTPGNCPLINRSKAPSGQK